MTSTRTPASNSNRTLLDSSSAWTLHQLAADIYAAGFEEGLRTSEVRERGARQRKFDADSAAKSNEVAS